LALIELYLDKRKEFSMLGYSELNSEIADMIKTYTKKGETCKISGEIELNNKFYREVIFTKRNLKSFKNEQQGYLYIDSDRNIITSKNVQKELAKLAHFYEVFFSGEKGLGILAALQAEDEVEVSRANKEGIEEGLDFLATQGIEDASRIKNVVNSLPKLREQSNKKINELAILVKEAKEQMNTFNDELLQKLYPEYEDILRLNFEKVKLIGTLIDCCDYVKDQAEKIRKKWKIRIKKNVVGQLLRVSDEISYYRRVIRTYEKVLNMSTSQYMKFLTNLNKEKAEARANSNRV
jgi:hypothetical protein